MSSHDDDMAERIVETLAAADAIAGSADHYVKRRSRLGRIIDSRTTIAALIAIAVCAIGYSVWQNRQAVSEAQAAANVAHALAAASDATAQQNARGQIAAAQLVCTVERDIRINSTRLTHVGRRRLVRYDHELHCGRVLKLPIAKLDFGNPTKTSHPTSSPPTTPPPTVPPVVVVISPHPSPHPSSHPTRHSPSPSPSHHHHHHPPPPSKKPTPSPTSTCVVSLGSTCIVHKGGL